MYVHVCTYMYSTCTIILIQYVLLSGGINTYGTKYLYHTIERIPTSHCDS